MFFIILFLLFLLIFIIQGVLMTEKEKEGLTIGEIGKQLYLSETDYLRNLTIAIEVCHTSFHFDF